MNGVMRGTVKNTINDKGYCFIRTESGEDYFLHAKDLSGVGFSALHAGMAILFEPEETEKGKRARRAHPG